MFIKIKDILIPINKINKIDCGLLENNQTVSIHTEGNFYILTGQDAVDLIMRIYPSILEGKRMKFIKNAWVSHNLIGHVGLQLCAWLKLYKLGFWLHDNTIPKVQHD